MDKAARQKVGPLTRSPGKGEKTNTCCCCCWEQIGVERALVLLAALRAPSKSCALAREWKLWHLFEWCRPESATAAHCSWSRGARNPIGARRGRSAARAPRRTHTLKQTRKRAAGRSQHGPPPPRLICAPSRRPVVLATFAAICTLRNKPPPANGLGAREKAQRKATDSFCASCSLIDDFSHNIQLAANTQAAI